MSTNLNCKYIILSLRFTSIIYALLRLEMNSSRMRNIAAALQALQSQDREHDYFLRSDNSVAPCGRNQNGGLHGLMHDGHESSMHAGNNSRAPHGG